MSVPQIGGGKIVSIETLRQRAEKTRSGRPADALPTPEAPPATLELSEEAQALLDLKRTIAELRAEMKDLPDVRAEKVNEARLRLSTGYYDRPEVQAEIARSFLRESSGAATPPGRPID